MPKQKKEPKIKLTVKQKKMIINILFWLCVIIILAIIAKGNGLIK